MRWYTVAIVVVGVFAEIVGCGKTSDRPIQQSSGERGRTEIVYEIDLAQAVSDKSAT